LSQLSSPALPPIQTHWQRRWPRYVAASVAVVLVLYFFPSEQKAVSRSVLAVAKPAPGSSLVATLQTNALQGSHDELIAFEAARDLATRIEDMQVCVSAPEFSSDPASGCIPVQVVNKADLASPRVPAIVRLTPNRSSGTVKILITAKWNRYVPRPPQPASAGKVAAKADQKPLPVNCAADSSSCIPLAEKVSMTLGPVNLGIDKLSRFGSRLSRFLKDLTLPIILILLANWLTREAAERDRRRDEKEKELRDQKKETEDQEEDKRRKAEREQEEEKQISHILLPKVMRLSGNYYLPMTLHASKFVQVSTFDRAGSHDLTFYIFSFFHVSRSLREKEGGVFFKEMAAEQMFKIANNTVRSFVVDAVGGEVQFTDCLNHMETWLPAGERRWPRLAERPATVPQGWTDLEAKFVSAGQTEFDAIRYLLNALAATMHFESNAPYVYWYVNSRTENVFQLAQQIPEPPDHALGAQYAGDLKEFRRLLSVYRVSKEGKP